MRIETKSLPYGLRRFANTRKRYVTVYVGDQHTIYPACWDGGSKTTTEFGLWHGSETMPVSPYRPPAEHWPQGWPSFERGTPVPLRDPAGTAVIVREGGSFRGKPAGVTLTMDQAALEGFGLAKEVAS